MTRVVERFPSSSSDAVHEVKDPEDGGTCWCTCMGWKMSKKQPKQCSHMLTLVGRKMLTPEFTLVGSAAPTPTPVAVAAAATPVAKSAAQGAPQAMLAHPIEKAPRQPWGDHNWVAELKIDGMRLFHVVDDDGNDRQYARSGNRHDLAWLHGIAIPPGTILDGELAAGEMDTYARGQSKVTMYVFDALKIGKVSLVNEAWATRREAVELLVESIGHPNLRTSTVLPGAPVESMVAELFAKGGEGLMLKRKAGTYQEGKRSWDWLKAKGQTTYDIVVVDMEGLPTSAERIAAGWKNIRYGVYLGGKLTICGNLGVTGPPAELEQYIGKVVEIKGYGQSATTGAVRHPGFIRIREDKLPSECVL